jgi:hypothetical protein
VGKLANESKTAKKPVASSLLIISRQRTILLTPGRVTACVFYMHIAVLAVGDEGRSCGFPPFSWLLQEFYLDLFTSI